MMQTFDHPAGAWLLGAALPIVVLYLLRHRRPPRKVAALLLFRRAQRDRQAETRVRRPVPELSLLLQLLSVVLLALVAMRPRWGRPTADGQLAIVLDLSASMAARDAGSSTRLHRAKAEARSLLEHHAGSGRPELLVLAASEPRLAAGRDPGSLAAELDAVDAEDAGGDLRGALALAEEKLRGMAGARIVVLTDVSATFETAHPGVVVRRFGQPEDNVALFAARAVRREETAGSAAALEISAVVVGHTRSTREVRVSLRPAASPAGDRFEPRADPFDVATLQLEPHVRTPVRFLVPERELQGAYELTLDGDDALSRDDRAFVVVPPTSKLPVIVVGTDLDESPLVRALLGDPHVSLQLVAPDAHARIDVPSDALELFVDTCPAMRRGRDVVVFGPPPGLCLDVDVAERSPDVRALAGFRSDDPRVRFLSLDDVHVQGATTLRARGGEGVLAEDRQGALVVDASTAARTATIVGFSLGATDFVSKRSFVVFVRNLTELADQHRRRGGRAELRAGASASLPVPDDVTDLLLDGAAVTARAGELLLAPRPRVDLVALRWSAPRPGGQLHAVTYAAADESDLLRVDEGGTPPAGAVDSVRSSAATWLARHLHALLVALLLAVLTLELSFFGRRPAWTQR